MNDLHSDLAIVNKALGSIRSTVPPEAVLIAVRASLPEVDEALDLLPEHLGDGCFGARLSGEIDSQVAWHFTDAVLYWVCDHAIGDDFCEGCVDGLHDEVLRLHSDRLTHIAADALVCIGRKDLAARVLRHLGYGSAYIGAACRN